MHSTVKDSNTPLRIDARSRKIIVPHDMRVIGAAGDHLSEQLTFQAPRIIEGHDVANCTAVWLTWTDFKGRTGKHVITTRESDAKMVRFTWTVPSVATVAPGTLAIAVSFVDTDGSGVVEYKWGTEICKDMRVAASVKTHTGVDLAYDDGSETELLQINVDSEKVNASVYTAVRRVLYG